MGEDEFQADFNDEDGDDETDVGFEVDFSNKVKNGGEEDGNGNPGVVHGFGAGSGKDGRLVDLTNML